MQWSGLEFETASDLAAAARMYTTKPVTEDDVDRLFPDDYAPYDGYHLRDLLNNKGYKPRLSGEAATKLLELVAKAKSAFAPLPGEPMDLVFDLDDSIDAFLRRTLSGVTDDEYPELRDLVCSGLNSADGPDAKLSRVLEMLQQRLPGRQLEETPKLLEAFVRVQEAAAAMDETYPKYGQFWERCLQIARRVVNRGRRGTRRVRQLYVAEAIFDHLCHGASLSKGDLEGTNRNYARWFGHGAG
ncbi:MAG: hypothetical protein E6J43_02210 [Chloroflexi bacterium]|nr:MAG: hypothetical protein E6J43_02210 [Chloroflexota bacterium]